MVASALIGAGASLLGGILGRNSERKAIAAQNEYNKPVNIRARAEEAGFNPLLFIGPGVGQQMTTGGTNYLGAAIADAGMYVADSLAKKAEIGRLEKLAEENKKLQQKVQNLTIRPKVGGVYAQREAYNANNRASNPTDGPRFAGGGGADSVGPNGLSPIATVDPVDTRREVEIKPIPSGSGVMKLENQWLPTMWFPTIDGDEPLDLLDLPAMFSAIPQLAYHGGKYLSYGGGREGRPNLTRAEALRRKEQRVAERAAKRRQAIIDGPMLYPPAYNTHKGRHRPQFLWAE